MKNESGFPAPVLRIVAHSPPKRKIDRARALGLDNGVRDFRTGAVHHLQRGDESSSTPLIFRSIAFNLTRATELPDFFSLPRFASRRVANIARTIDPPINFYLSQFLRDRSISTTPANFHVLEILS